MEIVSVGFLIAHGAASIALGLLVREEVYEEIAGENIGEYEKRKTEEEQSQDSAEE